MKRYIVLTLVCIGIVSVGAIVASPNDPIRTLSQAEKADITAGLLCHSCNDCMASRSCPGAGDCEEVGGVCESTMMSKRENMDQKCTSGGSSQGGCGGYGSRTCYKYQSCSCAVAGGGGWTCNPDGTWKNMSLSFYKDPC